MHINIRTNSFIHFCTSYAKPPQSHIPTRALPVDSTGVIPLTLVPTGFSNSHPDLIPNNNNEDVYSPHRQKTQKNRIQKID